MKLRQLVVAVGILASNSQAAVENIAPSKLNFGNVVLTTTSPAQSVVLSNPTKKTADVGSVSIDGDFSITSNECVAGLGPGGSCVIVVSFAPIAAGVREGTLVIHDSSIQSPYKVKLSGTGVPVQVISGGLIPVNPVIAKGLTQQFRLLAILNNGTTQDLTSTVSWTSSATAVATIAGGLAFGAGQGSATITAGDGISTTLTVGPPVLQSISITPLQPHLPKGRTLQYLATGAYSDGTTQIITSVVQWVSANPDVASISATGLVTGLHTFGTSTISCSLGSVNSNPSFLSVDPPVLVSLSISPANPSIAVGSVIQLSAIGTLSDGSTSNLTNSVGWPAGGAISSTGLATGIAPGILPIRLVTVNGIIAETILEVGGVFSPISQTNLSTRVLHTATMLTSGKVLLAGGGANSADLFDPSTSNFTPTGFMSASRQRHTATLLNNGSVLVAGGDSAGTAEVYSPVSGAFSPPVAMTRARVDHTATILWDGKVLIAGGPDASAEIYDPAIGAFVSTGPMIAARRSHTATLLANGEVLIAGGAGPNGPLASSEIYNPSTGTFRIAGTMTAPRAFHRATVLNGGRILFTGGSSSGGPQTASAELYDPLADTFTATGSMAIARDTHTATLLTSGHVLISAGQGNGAVLSTSEKYDPATGTFSPTGSIEFAHFNNLRVGHTATLLMNGQVLVYGGLTATLPPGLYQPSILLPPGLQNITLDSANVTLAVGANRRFVATGGFASGISQSLASVIWASDSARVTLSNEPGSQGLVTGVSPGQAFFGAFGGPFPNNSSFTRVGLGTVQVQ